MRQHSTAQCSIVRDGSVEGQEYISPLKPDKNMNTFTFNVADEQLWNYFLDGRKEAFADIYNNHFTILYEYGMRLCCNTEVVKDCIQDLFVKLWINRENLKPTDAIKPYLYTALRSIVLNRLDQINRLAKREDRALKLHTFEMHYTVEDGIIYKDEQAARSRQILKALNNLTPRQKESIFLRYYLGLEYPEIASIMQISVKASYKIVARAITVMRKYFKEMMVSDMLLFLMLLMAI
ncbi:MAG: sigma-70 family RNA polymerase sigma factor [Chitinophagaceae bacterium]|nr:MAG: sigma-70 family RNA polymerase sigma factor [Chitinophagaceae bacterium]